MKFVLSIFLLLLLLFNSGICELIFTNDIVRWWQLRLSIYSSMLFLSFCNFQLKSNRLYEKFKINITLLAFGLCIAEIIDINTLEVHVVSVVDIEAIIISLVLSYIFRKLIK